MDTYNPGQKSHCFGHCPPPPTPCNVESACNDSGCEGPFKSTLHWGWRGDARICGVFAKVSQDFWPGLSENPSFHKTLDNVTKLEYILLRWFQRDIHFSHFFEGLRLTCYLLATYLRLTCDLLATYLLLTCYLLATYLLLTCELLATYLRLTCDLVATYLLLTCYLLATYLLLSCYLLATYLLLTCDLLATYLRLTCYLLATYLRLTCDLLATYLRLSSDLAAP